MAYVGQSLRRLEDAPLLRGKGSFIEDLRLPGTLHLWLVRSPHAHARLAQVDITEAAKAPGVVAVLTGADLAGTGSLPVNSALAEGLLMPDHRALEPSKVHAVGTPVAAVIAETRAQACDAADLVRVEYELLPAMFHMEAALREDAPLAHPEFGTNVALRLKRAVGDVEAELARAAHVIRLRVDNERIAAVPMETRGVVARFDEATAELTVWSSIQSPYRVHGPLAGVLGIPENRLRLIIPDLGGGFGAKAAFYREDALTAFAAMKLRRPVRWISTRTEDFLTCQQARRQATYVEAGVDANGKMWALKARIVCDMGGYMQFNTGLVPMITASSMSGPYAIPCIETEIVDVFTNTVATGPFRGAGKPEATLAIERVMDEAARVVGIDRAEIRRRNFIRPEQFPYQAASGLAYDSGDYPAAFDAALDLAGYEALLRERDERRARGELVGVGLAAWTETSAASGWESGSVRIEVNGRVSAFTGSIPMGQGVITCFTQIVADHLGAAPDDINIRHGDSAAGPVAMGSMGSRSAVTGGSAIAQAAGRVREKVLRIAAAQLEVSPADLEVEDSAITVRGAPDRRLTFGDVARLAYGMAPLPEGLEPGLEATAFFLPPGPAIGAGVYLGLVSIDRETGEPRVERFVGIDDCGRAINPMIVEGQVHGGVAQGIGQALWERLVYDENGQLLTGTLMDYAVPKASMLPSYRIERIETPTDVNPLAVKGVGEAGCVGAPPAIVGAVVDALSPFGVSHLDLPLTAEKLWRVMRSGV